MKPRVLYDLSLAHTNLGFSGIPQDARLLFDGLSFSKKIDLSGLLFSRNNIFNFKSKNKTEESSLFLHHLSHDNSSYNIHRPFQKIMQKFSPQLRNIFLKYIEYRTNNFDITPLESDLFLDLIWRNIFSQTCPQYNKQIILKKPFFWSRISIKKTSDNTLKFKGCNLKTDGFDFVVFQDSRFVKLSKNTKRIIRYHDAIPIFGSEIFTSDDPIKLHSRSVDQCAADSVYVCNSTTSLDQLSKISPIAAERARVIPYFLPKMEKQDVTLDILKDICIHRSSKSTAPKKSDSHIDLWLKKSKTLPEFILSVATIEPRKNFIGLINAWLKLRYKTGKDIKLMIVGKPGWLFDQTLDAIRPFVKSGDLIHLEGVAQHELPYLYAAATCFVFPSFIEGFGLPPNEAMQCDCPVTVSDISAHRYSCGDAALYFDPYDIDDMANKIEILIDKKNNHSLITDLIKKGRKNVQRYSREALLPLWEEMFNELKNQK